MTLTSRILGFVAAAALIVTAGCGTSSGYDTGAQSSPPASSAGNPSSDQASGTPSPPPQGAPAAIMIKDFAYVVPDTVAPGATITVSNQDSAAHTVTADDAGNFNVTIKPGGSATFTAPAAAGSFAFHCEFHPNMTGKLVVK